MFKSKPAGDLQNPPSSYESSKNSEKSLSSQTGTSCILPPRSQTLLPNSKIPKPILKKTGSTPTPKSNSSFNSRIKPPQITTNHPQNIKESLGSQDSPRKLCFQNDLPSRNTNSSENQQTVPTIPIGTPIITTRDKLTGILRFIGPTHFREGLWAGIELDLENTGKNDGSVSGKRYFTCPPNKGIFIDARAIRARGRPTSINKDFPENNLQVPDITFEKVASNSNSKSDLLNSTNNLFKTKLTNGTINESVLSSLPGLKTLSKKPSLQRISLPPKSVTENKEKSEILDRRISQPAPIKEEFKGLESDLAIYLSSEGANPTLIIQNLLSQLNSCQKQNELLQVRINRKRAQQEATRVLRNEMLDRSRQDRSNRRTFLNTSTSTIVPEILNSTLKNQTINISKDKDRNLIDAKIFQSPTEIRPSKEINEQFTEKDDRTVPPSSLKESSQKLQDLQAEFIELQTKIASKDETITELRGELLRARSSSRMGRRRSEDPGATERLKSLSEELESLKQDAAEEVSALQAQIGELKRQLNDDSRSVNPSTSSDQVEELKSKLNDSIKRSKDLEKEKEEIISNSQSEIQHLKQQLSQRSEAYSQLLQRLSAPDSNIASSELEIQGEREASQALIDQLVTDNEALQAKVRDLANNSSTFEDGISWRQYEELKEEKESYLASVESLQREREDFLSQIQDLKAALQNDGLIPNINPRSAGTLTQNITQLEERVRELEDELISAQSFSEKYQAGSLTSEDIHQNLIKELDRRHNNIVNLEARARGTEERGHQLAESNKQLISEIQALEEDNWGMSDMIRDLQEETAQLTNQVNNSDNKIKQLGAALEAASSNSSTARHLQKVLFQMEEIETTHQADSEYLYSMINDQDEELARLADREIELQEHIDMLESELESIKNQEFLSQYPESEGLHEPEFKRLSTNTFDYCNHCYDSGHSMDQCPLALEEFPESYLGSSEVDFSPDLGVSLSAMNLLT